ncbi:hypothetical protein C5746_15360 [Streptomyces atratus]|uniref:Haloacid dehalogenase-like hydrolase n=1 Tax=Streptomyces atratus TaxID=1893 RepID=A0A2Z5JCM1_STRAR|nr:hypothetical protein C5746_15360 [Streptomyces atratus]
MAGVPHGRAQVISSWLTDMDGVLIHEGAPSPGADACIKRLRDSGLHGLRSLAHTKDVWP